MVEFAPIIMEIAKEFGFPIVVAGWALWRYDKDKNIQPTLENMEEGLDRMELAMTKQAEISQELLITLKILHTVITTKNGGESK